MGKMRRSTLRNHSRHADLSANIRSVSAPEFCYEHSMKCSICDLRNVRTRAAIDRHLLQGRTIRSTAHKFHVGEDALGRHRRHMRAAITKAAAVTPVDDADLAYGRELLSEAASIRADALRLQHEAEAQRDIKTALRGLQARLNTLEATARLTGAIQDGSRSFNVNVEATVLDENTLRRMATVWLERHPPKQLEADTSKANGHA